MSYLDYLRSIFLSSGKSIFLIPVLTSFLVLLDLSLIKLMLELFSENDVEFQQLSIKHSDIVIYICGFIMLKFIFFSLNKYLLAHLISGYQFNQFIKLTDGVSSLSYIEFSKLEKKDLFTISDTGQKSLLETYSVTIQGLNDLLIFLFYIISALLLSFELTLIILLPVAIVAITIRIILSRYLVRWGSERILLEGELISSFRLLIEGFRKYVLIPRMLEFLKFETLSTARRQLNFLKTFFANLVSGFLEAVIFLAILIPYIFRSELNVSNLDFATVFILILRSLLILNSISGVFQTFLYNKSIINEHNLLFDRSISILSGKSNIKFIMGNRVAIEFLNLKLNNSTIHYEDFELDLTSRLIALEGVSGLGKTILFESILGLRNFKGEIYVKSPFKVKFGYVSKEQSIFYKSLDNLLVALKGDQLNTVNELIVRFRLSHLKGTNIADMSSGQRVKVGLLDVIRERPNILIVDEAFSSFTLEEENYFLTTLLDLEVIRGIIIVSHRHNAFYNKFTNYSMKKHDDKIVFKQVN